FLTRVAPMGALAGQVLGTVGRDGYGQLGLELFLDKELRGTDGWKYVRQDVRKRYYPGFGERMKEAENGLNVVLTLDAKLQGIVERALERGVQKAGAKQGVAIVVEPSTGDILAMANYPFFNPNIRESPDGQAWKNHAVCKVYEPGSTFKTITASALLEEGLVRPTDSIDAEGGTYRIGSEVIRDTKPHDVISFTDAMAYSSNIVFAKTVTRLKAETFYRYVRSFGFGIKTGLGLPAEESGMLKPVGAWSGRTQNTIAFGHEISATPLQVVMAVSAIANGGLLMKPRIVKGWADAEGNLVRENAPRSVRRVLSEKTAGEVKALMTAVVDYGTAKDIRTDRIPLAGKTGTAEKIDPETGHYIKGKFNSSFVGFAPADKPELVTLVLLDEPSQFKYGGQSAAPIFREMVDRLLANPDYPLARAALQAVAARPAPASAPSSASAKARSAGHDSVPAPDLLGFRRADALRALSGSGLAVLTEGEGDIILAQHPAPGARLPRSGSLTLTVGFPESRIMPDLADDTLRDALLKLKDLGLDVEYSGAGRIIHQEPPSGSPVKPGQKCVLNLGWTG
ncbi:MAG TPA: penicillin-binding transpeptidase domain-containing protein, partial [Fibrobacteria bacterium]|nr:penicillin-binding transpeptidase domain-containing protein [Fibrobacteria bacterium]